MNKVGTLIGNDTNFINSQGAIPSEQERREEALRKLYSKN